MYWHIDVPAFTIYMLTCIVILQILFRWCNLSCLTLSIRISVNYTTEYIYFSVSMFVLSLLGVLVICSRKFLFWIYHCKAIIEFKGFLDFSQVGYYSVLFLQKYITAFQLSQNNKLIRISHTFKFMGFTCHLW